MQVKLSLCMIVKNEQENLSRCIDSVKDIVDEIIIVDTGSKDDTINIAQNYGAKVYSFLWDNNFSNARNESLKYATGDWILLMDADDQLCRQDKELIFKLMEDDSVDIYYGITLSYIGSHPGTEISKNLNPRLLRNFRGYHYEGKIHEQLTSKNKNISLETRIKFCDVRFYHYGYLQDFIISRNKRQRNISLLQEIIIDKPEGSFELFCLGNEYMALFEYDKAILCYEKAMKTFNPEIIYSPKLVYKLANAYFYKGYIEDALNIIDMGLVHFPHFTELEYTRALLYLKIGLPLLAIKHLNRCLEMGESPPHIGIIVGVGSYQALELLGEIYMDHEDYSQAAEYFHLALEILPEYEPALRRLIIVYCKQKLDNRSLSRKLADLKLYGGQNFNNLAVETLISQKYYKLALNYLKNENSDLPASLYNKAICKFYLGNRKTCLNILKGIGPENELYSKRICLESLCNILDKKFQKALDKLQSSGALSSQIIIKVYTQFTNILLSMETLTLSDDPEESKLYTSTILDLLRSLLILKETELFEKALVLLNLVEDKTVFLKLAKLYFNEGFYKLASVELIRSIKLFDMTDSEGCEILARLKHMGY